MRNKKPMLSPEAQIKKLEANGISFNMLTAIDALDYLKDRNNYFRVTSYRKNYEKYLSGENEGKYIDLDFGYLKELASIDMSLRLIIIKMCLDLEHCLKVRLLSQITANECEDGYDIVEQFLSETCNKWIIKNIYSKRRSTYLGDLINKYFIFSDTENVSFTNTTVQCPVWAFTEIITFGEFIDLYQYCCIKCSIDSNITPVLRSIKSLRNACAHNNCVIHNLRTRDTSPGPSISQFIGRIETISKSSRKEKLAIRPVYEIVCLLYLFHEYVDNPVMAIRMSEFNELVNKRMTQNSQYFANQQILSTSYVFLASCKMNCRK